MTNEKLNIEVGNIYPARFLMKEIQKFPNSRIQIGHGLIIDEKYNNHKHDYYIDIFKLEKLKNNQIKVLSIINPCMQNFAYKLITSEEIENNLEILKKNNKTYLFVELKDLINSGYTSKNTKDAIKCINCVFKKNNMPFKASDYIKKDTRKEHLVKISYIN